MTIRLKYLVIKHLPQVKFYKYVEFLFLGFLLDKKVGVNQPKRIENAKILLANTSMDTDKIKASAILLQREKCLSLHTFLLPTVRPEFFDL